MKLKITFLAILSCASFTAQVKKISYNFETQSAKFFKKETNDSESSSQNFRAKDKIILVEVTGYNPLRFDLSVNSSPSVLFYQNKPSGFTFFGDIPKDSLSSNTNLIDNKDPLLNFKKFSNTLVNIKNTIESLKAKKCLTKEEMSKDLACFVNDIKDTESKCKILDCATDFRIKKQKLINAIDETIGDIENEIEKIGDPKKEQQKKELQGLNNSLKPYSELLKKINDKISEDLEKIIFEYSTLDALDFSTQKRILVENTDEIKFELEGNDKFLNKKIDNQIIAKLPVKKLLKISYSTGGFWASRLFDEDYSKKITLIKNEDNTEEKMYSINKIDGGKQSYGAMAFINFHTQFPDMPVNFGASLGTGLIFNQDAKLVISPTLSFLFGDSQRAILHVGLAFAQVERIESYYADDALFENADYTPDKKKFFKSSLMAGLSWNLTK